MMEQFKPEQFRGALADIVSKQVWENRADALLQYGHAKERLFHCNQWHDYAGATLFGVSVYDPEARRTPTPVGPGLFLAVSIREHGNTEASVVWLQVQYVVEDYRDDEGLVSLFTVKPCSNPVSEKTETHQFFDEDSSSTFIIRLLNSTVYAEIHGCNPEGNQGEAGTRTKTPNCIIAGNGMAGESGFNWAHLTNGLIKPAQPEGTL